MENRDKVMELFDNAMVALVSNGTENYKKIVNDLKAGVIYTVSPLFDDDCAKVEHVTAVKTLMNVIDKIDEKVSNLNWLNERLIDRSYEITAEMSESEDESVIAMNQSLLDRISRGQVDLVEYKIKLSGLKDFINREINEFTLRLLKNATFEALL